MRLIRSLFLAIRFLTIIPLPQGREDAAEDLALAMYWFPVVGLGIGALAGGCYALVAWAVGPMVGAASAVACLAVVTGALHLDGLADTSDGLFGGGDRESRLRIMKDKAVGAFGSVAITLALLLKFVCVASLAQVRPLAAVSVLASAVAFARWAQVLASGVCDYARPEGGTGQSFVDAVGVRHAAISGLPVVLLWGVAVASIVMPDAAHGAQVAGVCTPLIGVVIASVGMIWLFVRRIGGITGDTLGALAEVNEVVFLACAAGMLGRSAPCLH